MTTSSTPSPQSFPQPDDRFAAKLRRFGSLGIFAILIILFTGNLFLGPIVIPVGAILVLVWVKLSRTPWRDIGYVRSQNWIATVALGLAFGIALKFLMKAIVMPLLGADPINWAYHSWAGNRALLPAAIWACLVAGWGEETVFRGYMFERLGKLFSPGAGAKIAALLITSVWFGLGHYFNQGIAGTEQATITGLVFGSIFAFSGRIFMLMCAHAAYDLTALAMIYWNLETRVAHLIFK
ncbi:MAG TPA: type II CAAX endopeptidase family protein [Candidatus Dormibacteraeota bacterium]|jgi:membrane protease YdiL (CAAX protease family)|nr:type II CAAX endopeptidase family protein [Candidatus Dormibacteraeota bacterium]